MSKDQIHVGLKKTIPYEPIILSESTELILLSLVHHYFTQLFEFHVGLVRTMTPSQDQLCPD